MKNNTLTVITFLAAVAAFVALPLSATAACIAFTVTGTLTVLAGDYGRSLEPLRAEAPVIPFGPPACASRELRRAA